MSFLDIFDGLFADDKHCELCNNRKYINVVINGFNRPYYQYNFLAKIPMQPISTDCWGALNIPCPACNIKVKNKIVIS